MKVMGVLLPTHQITIFSQKRSHWVIDLKWGPSCGCENEQNFGNFNFLFEISAAICNFFKLIEKKKKNKRKENKTKNKNRWSKLKGQLVTKPQCKKGGSINRRMMYRLMGVPNPNSNSNTNPNPVAVFKMLRCFEVPRSDQLEKNFHI